MRKRSILFCILLVLAGAAVAPGAARAETIRVVKSASEKIAVDASGLQAAGPAAALLIHGFGLRAASALLMPLEQREMGTLLSALGEMLTVLAALILAAGAMLCAAVGGASGCLGGGS